MVNTFDSAVAMSLAKSLKTIPGFAWDEDTLRATAEDLMTWCTGAIVENRVWPPEAQARWLVTQAREHWDKWLGTAALRQLFRAKFVPEVRAGNEAQPLGRKPPIGCSSCNDFGTVRDRNKHRYCDCDHGQQMEIEMGERWLGMLDKSISGRKPVEPRRGRGLSAEELEAEYFASQPPPEDD